MKLTTKVNVSADYLFTRLVDVLLYDILRQTNRALTLNDLEGFEYQTDYGTERVVTRISNVQPGRGYRIDMRDSQGRVKFIERLKLRALRPDQVEVQLCKATPATWYNPVRWGQELLYRHNLKKMLRTFEYGY